MSDYITATTHKDTTNHLLVFDSEGYYVVGDEKWQDITFTTTLIYNGGKIGIAPRIYDTNFYMYLDIHNEDLNEAGTEQIGLATLNTQVTYETFSVGQTKVAALVVGEEYLFKTEIRGTNYRIYLNDLLIFNIEYPGMSKGKVGIYATTGNTCKAIEVQSAFAEGWATNVGSILGAIVDIQELPNEDKYLYLSNPTSTELYVYQQQSVIGGKPHTLSFNANGSGVIKIIELDGAAPQTFNYVLPQTVDWNRESFTNTFSSDCTRAAIRFTVKNQELKVNDVQLEQKLFATGYIHNESTSNAKARGNSIITYPAKDNIKKDTGSLVIWFNPSITYSPSTEFKPVLFEYGTNSPLRLSYESGEIVFTYGAKSISYGTTLEKDTWYNVVLTWKSDRLQMYLNNVKTEFNGMLSQPDDSKLIRIGHSVDTSKNLFSGAIDETIILSSVLTEKDVEEILTSIEPIVDSSAMIMRATFNYAIGNFNKSIIEATLAPDYGSPVIVEKADGTGMRKVSFFDMYTGEYRTFNEELAYFDKALGYLELSYPDNDIDQETFKINVENIDGVTYGSPYSLIGRKLHLSLTDEEKELLDGQYLYVTYQLEDSFTVDFNIGVPDSFRITLGKHDGQPVKVVYEGNGFTDERLLTMVEMNPLLNPNHEGFLYITRNDEKVTSFRVRATPDDLPANGGSESLVVVEPLDTNGNYISHCRLDVSCEIGSIVPAYDEESIKLRDRAGRFLYRYRSPILSVKDINGYETTDYINVLDRETGIGVQIPITLSALSEKSHTLVAGDTIEKLAEHYGSTISDIAYTEDMLAKVKAKYGTSAVTNAKTEDQVIANARRYILATAGGATKTNIQIPINYSSKELEKNATAILHDKMIAYLANMLLDYMNQPAKNLPAGLGDLLDFNQDGIISVQEMVWLKENRLTTVLQAKYAAVLAWDNAN